MNRYQFDVLRAIAETSFVSQRSLSEELDISLGSVNAALRELVSEGSLDEKREVTAKGKDFLEAHRVRHAVILAAGAASRLAPLSFERPKGLFKVRGEVLIERLIRQLRAAKIDDICIVVGHMKERFYYLEDRFGVKLIENPDHLHRNNNGSVSIARDHLKSAYICSSDQYLEDGFFRTYEYSSYCTAVYYDRANEEQALKLGGKDRITGIQLGAAVDAWCMQGPAYLDEKTAESYLAILDREYDEPETAGKLWERILLDHARELEVIARKVGKHVVREFDYLDDLTSFDTDFLENVDSEILDNICRTLRCERSDISQVEPLLTGLTNLSVLFDCKGGRYVYRHPGAGTDEIINRRAEVFAAHVARGLGLDTSFVYEDEDQGWKISHFIPNCVEFDYFNAAHVSEALAVARKLHESAVVSPWSFDFYKESVKIEKLLRADYYPFPEDFADMQRAVSALVPAMRAGAGNPVLCHNDFYGPNLLTREQVVFPDGSQKDIDICLIDWEYAAMGDYGYDIGNFVAQGSGYTVQQAIDILPKYFGREPREDEVFHCLACVAVVGWYWYVWGMYKESKGASMGQWLRIWYTSAKEFTASVSKMLDKASGEARKLSQDEFTVLTAVDAGKEIPDDLIQLADTLVKEGFMTSESLTLKGLVSLEPHRVKRAVFFAAGCGTRMLPITINTPKPLVRVKGLRIIDRLLDAVVETGIEEIYVVRGHLKEEFDQLKAKYPSIVFIDNPIYQSTNNISSALQAKDHFQNAYAFESDLFLTNPALISKYQYRSNYLAIPVDSTPDWCFDADETGKIIHIAKGKDAPCWQMVGASYWSAEDGARLAADIPEVFARGGECQQIFWDDVALDRKPDDYDVYVRQCSFDDVVEIDSFAELQAVDPAYRMD